MSAVTGAHVVSAGLFLTTFLTMTVFVLSALDSPFNWVMAGFVGVAAATVFLIRRRLNAPESKETESV